MILLKFSLETHSILLFHDKRFTLTLQSSDFKIREIFSILSQGIEVIQYVLDAKGERSAPAGMIVWMVSLFIHR
jgi:hypothetical protein